MHYEKQATVNQSQMQDVFASEPSQRTVLPPTKRTAGNSNSKQPLVNEETHFSTFQEIRHNTLSKANHFDQLQQNLLWTMPHKCEKLSASESLNHRIVLPKAEPDVRDGQHRRRVILPEGKTKSQPTMPTTAAAALQQSQASSTSKILSARQACEEELEFLKLKLRYMQNDIEFKQKQIDSAQTSKLKGSSIPQQWKNMNGQRVPAGKNSEATISNHYFHGQQSHLHPRPSKLALAAETQIKTNADMSNTYSHLQMRNTSSSADTVSYQPYSVYKSNESSIKTKSNSFPIVAKSNDSPTLYSWSSCQKDAASYGHLRPASSSSDYIGALSSNTDLVISSKQVFNQLTYFAENHPGHMQTPQINYPTSSYPTSTNIFPYESQSGLLIPLSTAGPTASTFEPMGKEWLSRSPQSVCVSPDQRLVLPSKSVPADSTLRAYQTVPSPVYAETFPVNIFPKYISEAQGSSIVPRPETHLHHVRHSESSGSAMPSNKYKLVKNSSSLPAGVAVTLSSFVVPPLYHIDSNIHPEYSQSILPAKPPTAVRRTSQCTRLSLQSSNLKIQTAAKLVSKYKLKRLSPTSASLTAPQFFLSRKTDSVYEQEHHKHFGLYNKHKLDRRPMSIGSTTPTLTFKKPHIYSGLAKKHKIDNRSSFYQSLKATRSPQLLIMKNKLKLDNRVGSSKVLLEKLAGEGIQDVHVLDRRYIKHELKVSPRQGIKNPWVSNENVGHPVGRFASVTKRPASKFHWKIAGQQQSETAHRAAAQNSRFKWSRPNVQSQNGAWQPLRQKLQLLLNKKYRHSRFKFYKHSPLTAAPSLYNETSRSAPSFYNETSKSEGSKINLVTIDGIMYKSSRSKLTRARRSSGSHSVRKAASSQNSRPAVALKCVSKQKRKLISVGGVHFNVDQTGKKLCRTASAIHGALVVNRRNSASHSDFNIVNFANRAIHRSKAITAARYKKSNSKLKNETPHCKFFVRFGKCHRADNCPFIHDPEQVAVCTRFLRGKCDTKDCPFSHKASLNKMPVCLFFLRGNCFRENCPYLHVRVNPGAPVCKDFRNGFCALGEMCKKIHSHVCPSFAMTGKCSRAGICTMLHRMNKRETEGLSTQAKSLSRKVNKQPHNELRRFVRGSQPLISGTLKFTPTSSAALEVQPSFISLVTNPLPSFISLETSHQGGIREAEEHVPCEKPVLSPCKTGLSVQEAGQSSAKDTAPSIRPSFLAKKFPLDKTSEQSIPLQSSPKQLHII